MAERIRLECRELMPDPALCFSVSIGVAGGGQAGYDLSRLLALADQALYRAKANGRNRVEHYAEQPMPG
ncbi:putative diguanylate cyclase YedQ [compost metagenome]